MGGLHAGGLVPADGTCVHVDFRYSNNLGFQSSGRLYIDRQPRLGLQTLTWEVVIKGGKDGPIWGEDLLAQTGLDSDRVRRQDAGPTDKPKEGAKYKN